MRDILLGGGGALEPGLVDAFAGPPGAGAPAAPEAPPPVERDPPAPFLSVIGFRGIGATLFKSIFEVSQIKAGSYPRREAHIYQKLESDFVGIQYDQYELAVPLENAGSCLRGIVDGIASLGMDGRDDVLTPPVIRFVGQNDAYLSLTRDGPAMYVNIEVRVGVRPRDAAAATGR